MSVDLIIRLKGEIQDSNFDAWRLGLIERIKAADRQLVTDEDFITADKEVKAFKVAERSLLEAKEAALVQAADITALFSQIDEISGQCKQTRLNLERQRKQRMEEIKGDLLQAAAVSVRDYIQEQDEDFQLVAPRILDPMKLQAAIKGKRTIATMQEALDEEIAAARKEVDKVACGILSNAIVLDRLAAEHKPLFQDRKGLLGMYPGVLLATVEKRIQMAEAAEAKRKQEEAEAAARRERQEADKRVEDARRRAAKEEQDRLFRKADERLVREQEADDAQAEEEPIVPAPALAPEFPDSEDTEEQAEVRDWCIRIYFAATKEVAETLRGKFAFTARTSVDANTTDTNVILEPD